MDNLIIKGTIHAYRQKFSEKEKLKGIRKRENASYKCKEFYKCIVI